VALLRLQLLLLSKCSLHHMLTKVLPNPPSVPLPTSVPGCHTLCCKTAMLLYMHPLHHATLISNANTQSAMHVLHVLQFCFHEFCSVCTVSTLYRLLCILLQFTSSIATQSTHHSTFGPPEFHSQATAAFLPRNTINFLSLILNPTQLPQPSSCCTL
jgi:hypothetical protein